MIRVQLQPRVLSHLCSTALLLCSAKATQAQSGAAAAQAAPAPAYGSELGGTPKTAPPTFLPSGIEGTTAPSGYATGVSEEDEPLTLARDLTRSSSYGVPTFVLAHGVPECDRLGNLLQTAQEAPSDAQANHALGLFYLAHGQIDPAVKYLERARVAQPAGHGTAVALAVGYLNQKRALDALKLIDLDLASEPGNAHAHTLRAEALRSLGRQNAAVSEYKLAANLDPSEETASTSGLGLLRMGEAAVAASIIQPANRRFPRSGDLWLEMGLAEILERQRVEAVQPLLLASAVMPDDFEIYAELSRLSGLSHETDQEIELAIRNYLHRREGSGRIELIYADALLQQQGSKADRDTLGKVESHLRAATQFDPKLQVAFAKLGELYEETGDDTQAIATFSQAVKLDPLDAQSHYRLAQAYRRQHQTVAADAELHLFMSLRSRPAPATLGTGNDPTLLQLFTQLESNKVSSCPTK